jgi:hypothetical protein
MPSSNIKDLHQQLERLRRRFRDDSEIQVYALNLQKIANADWNRVRNLYLNIFMSNSVFFFSLSAALLIA